MLSHGWDGDLAETLFSALTHQGTNYGASYAAVPHLLEIAGAGAEEIRREIAIRLGAIALHAMGPSGCCGAEIAHPGPLQGFRHRLEDWEAHHRVMQGWLETADRRTPAPRGQDREAVEAASPDPGVEALWASLGMGAGIDTLRSALDGAEIRAADDRALLQRAIAAGPVTAAEMPKIAAIAESFAESLPRIRALSETEARRTADPDEFHFLLRAMAAASGRPDLALALGGHREGHLACPDSDARLLWRWHAGRMALYEDRGGLDDPASGQRRRMADWSAGTRDRADQLAEPAGPQDDLEAELLVLACEGPDPELPAWLGAVFGGFACPASGRRHPVRMGVLTAHGYRMPANT